MKTGPYTLSVIEAGKFKLDGGAMFGSVPKALWNRTNPADDRNRIDLCMRCLLIQDDTRNILVDCGSGTKYSEKEMSIFGFDYSEFSIEKSLAGKGLKPEDITDLVFTHLHFDHGGGATCIGSEGTLQLTFPEASYHVQRENWETAINPNEREKASYLKDNLIPLENSGRLYLIDGATEIFPGISVAPTYGHTAGMQPIKIEGLEETFLYVSDLCPTIQHLRIPFTMGYDLSVEAIMKEKAAYWDEAEKNNWIILFEHDPLVHGCRIKQENGRHMPVEIVTLP